MLVLLMSALLAAADPAPPEGPGAVAPNAPPAAAKPADKQKSSDIVCWDEQPTGSHFSNRVCATRDQRDKAQREAEQLVNGRRPSTAKSGFPH